MTRRGKLVWLLSHLLLSAAGIPTASGFQSGVKGYAKYLSEADHFSKPDTLLTGQLLHQRTQLRADFNEHWYVKAEIRTRAFIGPLYESMPDLVQTLEHPYSYFRPEVAVVEDPHLTVFTEADRAYGGYKDDRWDIRLGKQRINWGTNLVWNPNDLFNTYDILDFDYEERPGTDALRIQYDFHERRAMDFAYAPAKDGRSVLAGMFRSHAGTFDLQFSAGSYRGQGVAGAGWAGNLGNTGFKGEINHFVKRKDLPGQSNAAITVDHTFKGNWYIFFSGLWQDHAADSFKPLDFISGESMISPKYLMPYRLSAYIGAMKELTPKWSAQLAGIYGDRNESLILYPAATWKVSDEFELLLTGQAYFTRSGSAWGNQAEAVWLRLKYNF